MSDPRIKRMDSMMIAANIRKLSCIELLYTCVAKLTIYLHQSQLDIILKDADKLLGLCGTDYDDVTEYQGYAANLEETVGKNGSVITDYQYERNNYRWRLLRQGEP